MEFMYLASFEINRVGHHPRWQNTWHTVELWLSTWDVQFEISELDVDMANYLNRLEEHVRALPALPQEPPGGQPLV
jgi:pterin-4a-carbinolamine dehydratase